MHGQVLDTERHHGDADGVRDLAQALKEFLIAFVRGEGRRDWRFRQSAGPSVGQLQRKPGNNVDVGTRLRLIPAIHQNGRSRLITDHGTPLVQAAGSVLCGRRSRIDLDGLQAPALFNEQIDFMSGPVAPEAQLGWRGRIEALFQVVSDDPGFKQGAPQRVAGNLCRRFDTKQPGHQTGVVKTELGCFDQALVEVLMMRWQSVNDVTRLQNRYPFACRVVAQTRIVAECTEVEKLPCAPGAKAQE